MRTRTLPAVRSLRPEDREPLHRLLVETQVFTEGEVAIALELIDTVLHRLDQKDYIINVAASDNGVDGYYCIGPTPGTEGTFDLYWIAVKPSEQGHGIGGQLNRHAEALVQSKNGRLIIAETSSTHRYDATRAFYVRQGYAELARIPGYYRPGDDLVVYGKYLTQPT